MGSVHQLWKLSSGSLARNANQHRDLQFMKDLGKTDLIIDEVYGGSRIGNVADDPLPSLLGVDNSAGFRHLGERPAVHTLKLLVLKSSMSDTDWPDKLDRSSGQFTYYGDNKKVGEIHDTPRQGNLILRNLFDAAHDPSIRTFPPIFLFGSTGVYRDVRFLGLAVPGSATEGPDTDLVAIWRTTGFNQERFQNYRALLTVLDVSVISRKWIEDIKSGHALESGHVPKPWRDWVEHRKYSPLTAPQSINTRTKQQQLPSDSNDKRILSYIHRAYLKDPHGFERCAMELARLMMPSINGWELTKPWRDGGRDAIGTYRMGLGASSIEIEFALEAKCNDANNGVGVRQLSRLISRLRHRQFGILVTTSYLADQAYNEVKADQHPVVIVSGIDIVNTLKERVGPLEQIQYWLESLKSAE